MKKTFKRIFTFLIATVTCLSMGLNTFAAEATTSSTIDNPNDITEDNIIIPRGSIGGYATGSISSEKNYIVIYCTSTIDPNQTSGMGITVQTRCSKGNYVVGVHGYANDAKASSFEGSMTTNDETYYGGTQWGCTKYTVYFSNIPSNCPPFDVTVWIYG